MWLQRFRSNLQVALVRSKSWKAGTDTSSLPNEEVSEFIMDTECCGVIAVRAARFEAMLADQYREFMEATTGVARLLSRSPATRVTT